MNTKSSNIFAGLNITPQLQTSINTNVEWNPHQNHIAKWSLYSTHKPQERAVVNLSYDWIKNGLAVLPNHQSTQHLSQLSTSMVWPLTRKWHVLGQIRYDLQFQRMISSLAGVEYNSCCFALQLVGSRYLRPNQAIEAKDYAQGIYLQLMFKGLSTVGTLNIENKLQQAIPNYTPFRQYNTFD
jgi:LPS-assembly protein